ncbi:phage tail assembly protein [Blastochloris tepida]|uniref:Phage tail assembly protein n=1 Tax=Blastochloris tepida TaxID=2233851 RepID=A0A348FYG5_9HYPH|nr:phage tail assembly protein [Blastochloris tepida]BBF92348.1 hypothetical protein BLTE_10330 [Blastochloris tepida]
MSEPVQIALVHPFEFKGVTYREITLRRATARDVRRMAARSGSDVEKGFEMLSDLSQLPAEVIDEIDGEDFTRLMETISGFFGSSPATSKT